MSTVPVTRRKARANFQFYMTPAEVMRSKDFSSTVKLVFAVVLDNARGNKSGLCKLCNRTIGSRVGRGDTEAQRALTVLEEHGLIRRLYSHNKRIRTGIEVLWAPEKKVEEPQPGVILFAAPAVDGTEPWNDPNLDASERYSLYLCSRHWAVRREAVRKRSGEVCERCGKAPMAHVHHLTYARRFAEPLEDLQAVCLACHAYLHAASDHDPTGGHVDAHGDPHAFDPFGSFSVVA